MEDIRFGHKTFSIFGFATSRKEIIDLLKSWIAISFAFAVILTPLLVFKDVMLNSIIAALTVGTGFLLHELGHKVVAQHYKCKAEFRSFDFMLLLAIAMSFVGFVFAAPGAVFIEGRVNKKRNGHISLAGPLVNIILALIFLTGIFVFPNLSKGLGYGFMINAWIALFNMIPLGNFDGKKILAWDKGIYFLMLGVCIFLVFSGFGSL